MKFLKASVVILFFLSLLSCGLTLFLSTVRENEKEKRLQLEQLRTQLEQHISSLESEKTEAERQISDLTAKVQGLADQLQKEQAGRAKTETLLHQKEDEVKSVRSEMAEVDKAFANAQKRNRQLEQILDELEARIKELETQSAPPPPVPEVGYVQLDVNAPGSPSIQKVSEPAPSSQKAVSIQPVPSVSPAAPVLTPKAQPTTQASAEKPKKKKKGVFSFLKFRRSKSKTPKEDVPPGWEESAKPVAVQTETKSVAVQSPVPPQSALPKLTKTEMKPVSVPVAKTESPKREAKPPESKRGGVVGTGHVLLVNRKFNFVVTDLGSKQGLALDDMLAIEKNGGASVAKARVEKIYDDYCAAYLVEEQSETRLEEGDLVRPA